MGNPFGHQGLAFDVEIGSYQNRHRQYTPKMKRFMQKDPLATESYFSERNSIMFSVGVCNVLGVCQVSEPTVIVQTGFTRAYDDGLNIYVYTRSSPLSFNDSFGLSTECGGGVTCGCDGGPKNWPVKGDSNRAKLILIGDGCVVLAGSKEIVCTGSCSDIKTWVTAGPGPSVPILEHECCHACALEDGGWCAYLATWIPGDLTGHCNRNPKSADVHF